MPSSGHPVVVVVSISNWSFIPAPRAETATTHTTAMSETNIAYSTIVAPSSGIRFRSSHWWIIDSNGIAPSLDLALGSRRLRGSEPLEPVWRLMLAAGVVVTVRACRPTARFQHVFVVGLTGGIGSGKSTVSSMFAARGAVIIDADLITRQLQQPGAPVFEAMVERFGERIIAPDGTLDRQAVADIVFHDAEALADLNSLVHPAVGAEIANQLGAAAEAATPVGAAQAVVILDVPLLVETGRSDVALVVVVDAHEHHQHERLVTHRGLDPADASARMSRQASRSDRLEWADIVIDNTGDLAYLENEVERAWQEICVRSNVGHGHAGD